MKFRAFRGVSIVSVALLLSLAPRFAKGDVTIRSHVSFDGTGGRGKGQRIVRIKGTRMRLDYQTEDHTSVTIYDLQAGTEVILEAKHKRAETHDLLRESAAAEKSIPASSLRVSIKPTGKATTLLGRKCHEFSFDLIAPVSSSHWHGMSLYSHLTGTMYISEESPESKEVAGLIEQAMKRKIIFGGHEGMSADARLETGLYFLQGLVHGLMVTKDQHHEIEGGPGVGAYGSSIWSQSTLAVDSIEMEAIPDELFVVPTGWKVKPGDTMIGSVPVRLRLE